MPQVKYHKWIDEERDIVRRDYKGTHASAREIGHRLGVSEFGVRDQVQKMGLATRSDRRPWDPKQDDQLRALITRYPPRPSPRRCTAQSTP
jgi:hypothetical protein